MTANRGRPDVRLLAALDAGLLDEATAREVRAAADADPAARAVLAALAATRAELAALPDPPVPPALAERWSAALAAEQSRLSAPTPQPSPSAPQQAAPPPSPGAATGSTAPQAATPVSPRAGADPLTCPPPPTRAGSAAPSAPSRPGAARSTAPHSHALEPAEPRPSDVSSTAPASTAPAPTAPAPTTSPAAPESADSQSPAYPPSTDRSTTPQRDVAEPTNIEPRVDAEPAPPPSRYQATPGGRSSPDDGRRGSASRPPRNPVRRPGRWLRRPAVLAAALLVAVGVVAALRARPEPLPAVGRPQLVAEALSALGVRDTAGLAEPTRRAGCLRAVGAPVESPEAALLGGRRVTFEGSEGVLLVLGTGRRGAFDVLIVDPDCGPGAGRLFAATRVTPP
jgi:hypothetical protein